MDFVFCLRISPGSLTAFSPRVPRVASESPQGVAFGNSPAFSSASSPEVSSGSPPSVRYTNLPGVISANLTEVSPEKPQKVPCRIPSRIPSSEVFSRNPSGVFCGKPSDLMGYLLEFLQGILQQF